MKMFLGMIVGALLGASGITTAVGIIKDPIPYTLACFQPDRGARALCHRTMDIATFRNELGMVFSDPGRLTKEGPSFIQGLQMMIDAGISSEEVGVDPETLKFQVKDAERFYRGDAI